jgi:hypothetical protein
MDDYGYDALPLSFTRVVFVSESRFSITSFSPAAWEVELFYGLPEVRSCK